MILLYNILIYIYFFICSPFYIYKLLTSAKYRTGLKQRLGFVPDVEGRETLLLHTVSVGEFIGALPVINKILSELPEFRLVVSTTTLTGNRIARKRSSGKYSVVFFPLDFRWAVKRCLDKICPKAIILMETELWPNFINICNNRKIPVIIINGRLSKSSFKGYFRFRYFFENYFGGVRLWGVQCISDSKKLERLKIENSRIKVTGSMKYDSAIQSRNNLNIEQVLLRWGKQTGDLVLVGGSTHRGEEKLLINIYQRVKSRYPGLHLILVPRHPERSAEIELLLNKHSLKYILGSKWNSRCRISDYPVVLINTLGELFSVYALADIVFIGKSLRKGGGQNIIEPASLGKPIICGPMMGNFREITREMVNADSIVQVNNDKEFETAVCDILHNENKREVLGKRAKIIVDNNAGAVQKNINLIKSIV